MKTISARDLQRKVRECLDQAQGDRVLVTRHGKPAAVVIGVEGADWETVLLQTSPKFWKLIEERRKQPTVPLRTLRERLVGNAPRRQR